MKSILLLLIITFRFISIAQINSAKEKSNSIKEVDNSFIADDSLKRIQTLLDTLNSRKNRINNSIQKYYTFEGKNLKIEKRTFETYKALRNCEIYYLESDFYEKHKTSDGYFKLGGIEINLKPWGLKVYDDIYFGLNFGNQTFVKLDYSRFNHGKGVFEPIKEGDNIDVSSTIYWYPNESIDTKVSLGKRTKEGYIKSRNDFFEKVKKQFSSNPSFHLLEESEKKVWLTNLTNLDDDYFKIHDDSLIVSKEINRLELVKTDYITYLKNNKITEEKNKLAKIELERKQEANKFPGLVKIGSFYWQNQNCRITKYINGDPIYFAKNSLELDEANKRKEGAYCFINFNNQLDSNYIVYNWYAIMDPRGFGTMDLRLPNWADWKNLIATFEGDKKSFNDLKKIENWTVNKSYPASNYYGFNGTPAFYGRPDGYYQRENFEQLNSMNYWIPDDYVGSYFDLKDGMAYQVSFVNDGFTNYYVQQNKCNMFPVRLVKGTTSYFDGTVVSGKKQGHGKLHVRNDDNYRYDFVNFVNVQPGSIIEGNWIDNNLQGRSTITWIDGTTEDALFTNNLHQGALRIDQNKTQKCLYDGKTFSSHYKKTSAEIEAEKSSTKSIVIRAYKTELYCNSTCEAKAEEERLARQRQRESQSTQQNQNSTTSKTSVEKSDLHVYVCNDCGKIQTSKSSPYDKSTCPETRWGGIGGAGNIWDDGDHQYADLGNSGSQQFVCNGCHISIMLFEKPSNSGSCGARGSNCCSHQWEKN